VSPETSDPDNAHVCHRCGGAGEYDLLIHGGERQCQVCRDCSGVGVVSAEQWQRWERGRLLRRERLSRHLSLAEEARRRGITRQALSDEEWGRHR
jgi:hypothetical protein